MHIELRKCLVIADLCTVMVFSRGSTNTILVFWMATGHTSAHSYTQYMLEW